jgi:hypothetical protein
LRRARDCFLRLEALDKTLESAATVPFMVAANDYPVQGAVLIIFKYFPAFR